MPDVSQGKNWLTAIALTTCHGSDHPGRRHGRLGRVADAVPADTVQDQVPIDNRPAPIMRIWDDRAGWFPGQVLRVVNAALDCRKWPAHLRELDAGEHGVVAHELHHLRGKLLTLR